MKHGWVKAAFSLSLTAVMLFAPVSEARAEKNGYWELDEKTKRWMYAINPGEYLCDQWFYDEGKEYYLDANGYMKTGWFTDSGDGNKYYLGEDGAKCYNTFTADDKYVGPEGTQLELFDNYRKAVKKELKSFKKGKYAFLLEDFNDDGYRDFAVMNCGATDEILTALKQAKAQTVSAGGAAPAISAEQQVFADSLNQILQVSVWESEQKKFVIAAEADLDVNGEKKSWLAFNDQSDTAWLVMEDHAAESTTFYSLEEDGSYFGQRYDFTVGKNQWGDKTWLIDGHEEGKQVWKEELAYMTGRVGSSLNTRFVPLTEENINQAADRAPTKEEIFLWME